MEIDLDEALAGAEPWDLKIKIGGKSWPTQPISVETMIALQQVINGQAASADKVLAALMTLFPAGERPAIGGLGLDQLLAMSLTVMKYFQERNSKNFKGIAPAVTAAMRPAPTNGTSKQPSS
jgi:hypothetical protein